jgi:hypothetical protein
MSEGIGKEHPIAHQLYSWGSFGGCASRGPEERARHYIRKRRRLCITTSLGAFTSFTGLTRFGLFCIYIPIPLQNPVLVREYKIELTALTP